MNTGIKKTKMILNVVADIDNEDNQSVKSNSTADAIDKVDEELDDVAKIIEEAIAKQDKLRKTKELLKRSSEFLGKLKVSKQAELDAVNIKYDKIDLERDLLVDELETIEGIDEEEDDVMDFLVTNYADFVNTIAFPVVKTLDTKSKINPKTGKVNPKTGKVNSKTTTTNERWGLIPVGTQFRAKQFDFIRYYLKDDTEGVVECDINGTRIGNVFYNNNQEAANAFRLVAGINYAISGWEFLQVYNKQTNKTKGLKKWDGDMTYLNF